MKYLVVLLISVLTVGCSTSPISQTSGAAVPQDRIYSTEFLTLNKDQTNTAKVTFLRDSGAFGSACSHVISVDTKKVFAIQPGEFITLNLNPGDHFFNLATGQGLCPNIVISEDVTLRDGDLVEYRILLSSDGALRMTRIK